MPVTEALIWTAVLIVVAVAMRAAVEAGFRWVDRGFEADHDLTKPLVLPHPDDRK